MIRRVLFSALAFAACGQLVHASPIIGSVSFVPVGLVSVTGETSGGLGSITSVTLPATLIVNGPGGTGGLGDYSSVLNGSPVTLSPSAIVVTNVNGGPFAYNNPIVAFGPGSRFTFTPTVAQFSATTPDLNGGSSLSFTATGSVVDALNLFDATISSFSFSLTQSTLTGPINASFTLLSPAQALTPVPEPATFALASLGIVGMALVTRRRMTTPVVA